MTFTTHARGQKFTWSIENPTPEWIDERIDGAALSLMPFTPLGGREMGESRADYHSSADQHRITQQVAQRGSDAYQTVERELRSNLQHD